MRDKFMAGGRNFTLNWLFGKKRYLLGAGFGALAAVGRGGVFSGHPRLGPEVVHGGDNSATRFQGYGCQTKKCDSILGCGWEPLSSFKARTKIRKP